ncbi:MAG: hypothetical protein WAN93_02700 [Solirubrobacteraceae bacterium]
MTGDAPETIGVKQYAFDTETGSLEYLPGVVGSIISTNHDGSSFMFENTASSPFELDRWSAGPNGGSVTPIVQLPRPVGDRCQLVCVGPAYASKDGSVFVFSTESPIPGFNDGGIFNEGTPDQRQDKEIFRYDANANELSCVSCPPVGIRPSGDVINSSVDYLLHTGEVERSSYSTATEDRGMSSDGSRVFFDTPDPLVPQDVNGKYDVYEWENGAVFLLSSGRSPVDSSFLDSSESGDDVFFTTIDALVQGDTDGSRDVYDARVPRPGDNPPPAAVPCQGDVCQGPPSVPQLLGAPSSATFNGVGNLAPQVEARAVVKTKAKAKPKKKSKKKIKAKRGRKANRSTGHAERSDRGGK